VPRGRVGRSGDVKGVVALLPEDVTLTPPLPHKELPQLLATKCKPGPIPTAGCAAHGVGAYGEGVEGSETGDGVEREKTGAETSHQQPCTTVKGAGGEPRVVLTTKMVPGRENPLTH